MRSCKPQSVERIRNYMKIIEIQERTQSLLEIWENSVRATHLFLSGPEIEQIKSYVPQALSLIHISSGNDIFIQIINIFKNMYYKYFQELNKFMFENTKESEALLQSSLSSSDSHSKLYHYLTHQNDLDLNELMTTFTDGNKKRFQSYLQKRDRERKRKEAAQYSKKES